MLPGQLHQLRGLRGAVGHGFFDQQVFALLQEDLRQFKMGVSWGDDAEGFAGLGGIGGRGKGLDAILFGEALGGLRLKVVNAGEFDRTGGGEFGIDAGVLLAEGARA